MKRRTSIIVTTIAAMLALSTTCADAAKRHFGDAPRFATHEFFQPSLYWMYMLPSVEFHHSEPAAPVGAVSEMKTDAPPPPPPVGPVTPLPVGPVGPTPPAPVGPVDPANPDRFQERAAKFEARPKRLPTQRDFAVKCRENVFPLGLLRQVT